MLLGNKTVTNLNEISHNGSADVRADMCRFMKKRAEKMARDSEMSQINGMVSQVSRLENEIKQAELQKIILNKQFQKDKDKSKPTSTYIMEDPNEKFN